MDWKVTSHIQSIQIQDMFLRLDPFPLPNFKHNSVYHNLVPVHHATNPLFFLTFSRIYEHALADLSISLAGGNAIHDKYLQYLCVMLQWLVEKYDSFLVFCYIVLSKRCFHRNRTCHMTYNKNN